MQIQVVHVGGKLQNEQEENASQLILNIGAFLILEKFL